MAAKKKRARVPKKTAVAAEHVTRAELVAAKRRRFIAEYMQDPNGAEAARRAGYSEASAKEIAYKLLADPAIRAEIKRRQAAAAKRLEITTERIQQELAAIGFARLTDVVSFDASGVRVKASSDLTPAQASALAEIVYEAGKIRVRMHAKREALETLAKLCGLFVDRHEHTVSTGKLEIYLPDNGRRPRS
jgi:phage terminase small subunit